MNIKLCPMVDTEKLADLCNECRMNPSSCPTGQWFDCPLNKDCSEVTKEDWDEIVEEE